MKFLAICLVLALFFVSTLQVCPTTDITDPTETIDKALHTLEFLTGGTVKYNFTQSTVYNNQQVNITLIADKNSPITAENDACDFNGYTSGFWTDQTQHPRCNREIVANIPFQDFTECNNLQKSVVSIGGINYDRYAGVFAAVLKQKNGQVFGVDNELTTKILKIFTIKLQKEITLTTNLSIVAPQGVFEAAAQALRFNYDTGRLELDFYIVSNVNGYNPTVVGGTGTGSLNHPFSYAPSTAFNCPAAFPSCFRYRLVVNPNADCSWDKENYVTNFQVDCNGCLIQGDPVTVNIKAALADRCDIIDLQFDVQGDLTLWTDNTYGVQLVGPVSLDRTVYVQAALQTTFAPMIKVDLDDFYVCSAISSTCNPAHALTLTLKENGAVGAVGGAADMNITPLNPVIPSSGLSVTLRWAFDLKFKTGLVSQTHEATAGGNLLIQANLNVFYVNKKKRNAQVAFNIEEDTGNTEFAVQGTKFSFTRPENSAATAKLSALALVFTVAAFLF